MACLMWNPRGLVGGGCRYVGVWVQQYQKYLGFFHHFTKTLLDSGERKRDLPWSWLTWFFFMIWSHSALFERPPTNKLWEDGPQKEHSSDIIDRCQREEGQQKGRNLEMKPDFVWQMALLPPSELWCESDIAFSKMSSRWEHDTFYFDFDWSYTNTLK